MVGSFAPGTQVSSQSMLHHSIGHCCGLHGQSLVVPGSRCSLIGNKKKYREDILAAPVRGTTITIFVTTIPTSTIFTSGAFSTHHTGCSFKNTHLLMSLKRKAMVKKIKSQLPNLSYKSLSILLFDAQLDPE